MCVCVCVSCVVCQYNRPLEEEKEEKLKMEESHEGNSLSHPLTSEPFGLYGLHHTPWSLHHEDVMYLSIKSKADPRGRPTDVAGC